MPHKIFLVSRVGGAGGEVGGVVVGVGGAAVGTEVGGGVRGRGGGAGAFVGVRRTEADEINDVRRADGVVHGEEGLRFGERDFAGGGRHIDGAGGFGRGQARGAAAAGRFLNQVMMAGQDGAGERGFLPGAAAGAGVLDGVGAQVNGRGACVVEFDEVVLVSRAAVAAATVNLADGDRAAAATAAADGEAAGTGDDAAARDDGDWPGGRAGGNGGGDLGVGVDGEGGVGAVE